tara:strand:- start:739 stop:951 length:213 start_codon:yes stop_codon:yes gene_type:complete
MTSFLSPPSIPPIPPPPPVPEPVDEARAAAMADEAFLDSRKRKKGRADTIVAGALQSDKPATTGTPTLLG